MTSKERLTKLKQLKRARALVTMLESSLRAESEVHRESKPKPKPKSKPLRAESDQVADILIGNRVANASDEPVVFTSTSTAKLF